MGLEYTKDEAGLVFFFDPLCKGTLGTQKESLVHVILFALVPVPPTASVLCVETTIKDPSGKLLISACASGLHDASEAFRGAARSSGLNSHGKPAV